MIIVKCEIAGGKTGANELFIFNPIPNNLLVTWADPQNPQVIDVIETGDSLVTRWGIIYYDIIEEIVFEDHKTVTATDKDSLVTLFTNRLIIVKCEIAG